MSWRVAKSLEKLRDQINATYPNRSKATDGTIGDDAHRAQGSASDHNPNSAGVVTALDITHDPANGVDIDKLSDELVASRDPRIKYVIANGLIAGPYTGWQWQPSSGHYSHIHISVNTNNYDDNQEWNIGIEEEEVKVDKETLDVIYRLYTGAPATDHAKNNFLNKKTPAEVIHAVKNSQTFKDYVKGAASGKVDPYDHLPTELRKVIKPSVPAEFQEVKETLYRRK